MAGRRRLRSSSARSRAVGFRARNTEHPALGGDQPSRRPGVQPASKFVHRAYRCNEHMRGPIRAPRHIVRGRRRRACGAPDRLPSAAKILLAIVNLRNPRQQVAFASLKRNVGLEHRPVALAQAACSVVVPVGTSSGATNGVSKTFCSATTIDVDRHPVSGKFGFRLRLVKRQKFHEVIRQAGIALGLAHGHEGDLVAVAAAEHPKEFWIVGHQAVVQACRWPAARAA